MPDRALEEPSVAGRVVVVVDDSASEAATVAEMFTSSGWTARTAATVEEGVAASTALGASLLLIDLRLDETRGRTGRPAVEYAIAQQSAPVAVWTGAPLLSYEIKELIERGAQAVLGKGNYSGTGLANEAHMLVIRAQSAPVGDLARRLDHLEQVLTTGLERLASASASLEAAAQHFTRPSWPMRAGAAAWHALSRARPETARGWLSVLAAALGLVGAVAGALGWESAAGALGRIR